MTHAALKQRALNNAEVKAHYDALALKFSLLRDMLKACQQAGLSQAQVAERVETQKDYKAQ